MKKLSHTCGPPGGRSSHHYRVITGMALLFPWARPTIKFCCVVVRFQPFLLARTYTTIFHDAEILQCVCFMLLSFIITIFKRLYLFTFF